MTRRELLGTTAPLLASPLFAQKKDTASEPKPNILFIMADDLAAWMLGCYGNKEIRTPNIDELARAGMRFSNHFVCTPVCSASRATFFTGRTPMQHGIHDFLTERPIESPPQGQKAPPETFAREVMISDVLAGAGYRCGYVGKWHMGPADKLGHGYEYSYTMPGGSMPYQNPTMYLNGETVKEQGYLSELMTRRAGEFLDKQDPSRPFFLTVSYFNPHTPYDGHPQKYYDMYANTSFDSVGWEPAAPNALREKELLADPVGNLRKCAASTTALDDQVGALMEKLRDTKLWMNTLVVFVGDNGFLLGRHGLWSKGLASDPINMYDEVMRVPLLCSWPGKIPVESSRAEMVSAYDLVPSLSESAGVPAPQRNLCGQSYLELAKGTIFGRKDARWRSTVFGYFRNTEMARDERFKLVIRDGGNGPCELFSIANDPTEQKNLYDNPGFVTVRDDLRAQLNSWREKYSS